MAAKAKKSNRNMKTTKKPVKKTSRVVTGRMQKKSRLEQLLGSRRSMLVIALLFAGVGTYFLAFSGATPSPNASRGLQYAGLKKIARGPCAGLYQDSAPTVTPDHKSKACVHPDPGPAGVDVQERAKKVDAELAALAQNEKDHPPQAANPNNPQSTTAADVSYGGSLSAVNGNLQPCANAGAQNTYAIRLVYVYKAGNPNRFAAVNDGLRAIAHRVNGVMYYSSLQNGGDPRQIRFVTNDDCTLQIGQNAISGDINDFGNIKKQLKAQGRTNPYHKFLVWVDGGTGCGIGDVYVDSRPGQENYNNLGGMFAVVWKGCWNYAEPHEVMHTLGTVQTSAPHATGGLHCWDLHDVMCYDDGSRNSTMRILCDSTVNVWRYDCGKNDYFNSRLPVGSSNYLYNHWNVANSRFLVHY